MCPYLYWFKIYFKILKMTCLQNSPAYVCVKTMCFRKSYKQQSCKTVIVSWSKFQVWIACILTCKHRHSLSQCKQNFYWLKQQQYKRLHSTSVEHVNSSSCANHACALRASFTWFPLNIIQKSIAHIHKFSTLIPNKTQCIQVFILDFQRSWFDKWNVE